MKVLLLNGSPKEDGCTFTALSALEIMLKQEGLETEIYSIGAQAVHGCADCLSCLETGYCAYEDDCANEIIYKIQEADGLIVGTPVYYAAANSALTILLNRAFYAAGSTFAHKPAAAVASARRAGTSTALDQINKYFAMSQMPIVSSTYWNNIHGRRSGQITQDQEGLQTLMNLAKNMAWMLRCIEAGKEKGIMPPQAITGARTDFYKKNK
jgi:multimeric flavodoxin WrbA